MMDVLALQELAAREQEDDSTGPAYSGASWQTCY
jgi:hypothetical protein